MRNLHLITRLLATTSNAAWIKQKPELSLENRAHTASKSKPNLIIIQTDDQDLHLGSLDHQPGVQKHFAKEGTFFSKHFCTVSQCCPSRVSWLTGRAAHNTNVTSVKPPYGGYPKFVHEGWNDRYLPVWLQEAGYNTYYTGKLMNGHNTTNYNKPFPRGWNGTDFLVDPNTYVYYNASVQRNREEPKYISEYSTDYVANASIGFLEEALEAGGPFFMGINPIGPHGELIRAEEGNLFMAPVPADRHRDLFPGLKVPRSPNFNPDVPSGGGWIKTLEQQNETVVEYNDYFYRRRIQSLAAVDDLLDSVMGWLEDHPSILENTYIIYTTDNGFHIGNHRLPPGKVCNTEEDVNIPFFVRGPDVEKGVTKSYPTTHTDIVPTLFELAGIPLHEDFDGEPIPVTREMEARHIERSENINIEFWGNGQYEGKYAPVAPGLIDVGGQPGVEAPGNTYKTVRIVAKKYSLMYTVWCTNEHELYDMTVDPYQMNNFLRSPDAQHDISGYPLYRLVPRLDALLLTLKACKGRVCVRPWETLHPKGNVRSLADAMNPKYDQFYIHEQRRVTFSGCAQGYLAELEGHLEPLPFNGSAVMMARRAHWHDWS